MKIKFIKFVELHPNLKDDHRFTVGVLYDVIGSKQEFGKVFYTVIDNTGIKMNIPLDSLVYKFEVAQ